MSFLLNLLKASNWLPHRSMLRMESEDFGDTQPIEDPHSQASQAFTPSASAVIYWGRLYPLVRGLKPYDLVKNEECFGEEFLRDSKDICSFSSDTCFKIKRKTVKLSGLLKTSVQIVDNSESGIFVNDRKIPRNSKSKSLHTNDKISLQNCTGKYLDAYVFIDSCNPVSNTIPHQVTRSYAVTYRLGVGAFGEVFLAFDKANCRPLAMKAVLKGGSPNNMNSDDNKKKNSKILNELTILRAIDHPHIISLISSVECKSEHFIFLEFMEGKDLSERILEEQKLPENIAKLYFYQLSKAVEYLHSRGIIHRDIKPANVLLASASWKTIVKLTDFGLSKALTSTTVMKTICGTKMYAAPELLSGGSPYTSQVDIWSMGVLLYTCLAGTEPFTVQPHLIEKHIMLSLYVMLPDEWRNISTFAKNLIDTMLLPDPSKRIGINEILKDVWFQDPSMYARLKRIYLLHGLVFDEYN